MTAAHTAASPQLRAPVRRFARHQAAIESMAGYEAALCEGAALRRSRGLTVADQDQPEEAFGLFPEGASLPPLAIIGGMGPLAGSMAFRRACARFRDTRSVVLYQACSVPDRSAVILSGRRSDGPACREMASRLADAVQLAVSLAGSDCRLVRCILACNTAHYFWRPLTDQLRSSAPGQMISLVEAAAAALQSQAHRKTLLLMTEGARVGRVFSAPFLEAGIGFEEPTPELSHLLMRAIFEGVKSLDSRRAVELGNEFFERMIATGRNYDCLLAGCTEIPHTIDLLRLHGSPRTASFLSQVVVVDPLEEALRRA